MLGVTNADLLLTATAAALVTGVLLALHGSLLVCVFDPSTARALGRRPAVYDTVLLGLLALATLAAVQALGSLLVVAMLVGPAATARLVCHRVPAMMLVAGGFAVAAAVAGMYVSFHAQTGTSASVTCAVAALYVIVLGARTVVPAGGRRLVRARVTGASA